jgi:hypothetical protein
MFIKAGRLAAFSSAISLALAPTYVDAQTVASPKAELSREACQREYAADIIFIDIPDIFSIEKYENSNDPVINRIIIKGTDGYLWNGKKIDERELDGFLPQAIKMGMDELQFSPYGHSKFIRYINLIKKMNELKYSKFYFIDTYYYEEFEFAETKNNIQYCKYQENIITVRAFLEKNNDTNQKKCRIFWESQNVDDMQFYKLSTLFRNTHMKAAKTKKAIPHETTGVASGPAVVIVGSPDLPWECIAGPISTLESAGFVRVGLLAKPSQPVLLPFDLPTIPR